MNEEQTEKEVFQEIEGLVTDPGKNSCEKNHSTVKPQPLLTRAVCKTHNLEAYRPVREGAQSQDHGQRPTDLVLGADSEGG